MPKVTRTGIFEYKNADGSIRRELRLPEHVFDEESLATYEGRPVILTHAAGRVDKDNVDDEIVGTILSKGCKDGESVRVKVVIHNIDSVKQSGLRELSLGYDLVLDETPGTWNGKPYDAVQTKIKVNHLALVHDARAGEQARLNLDSQNNQILKGATEMGTKTKKPAADSTAAVDSKAMDSSNASASTEARIKAIKEQYGARRKDTTSPPDADKFTEALEQQDSDMGELLGIIESMQARADYKSAADSPGKGCKKCTKKTDKADSVSVDNIDAIVRERLGLARLGDRLGLEGLEIMNPLDAKKAIISTINPNMRLDGKSDLYIQAAFENAVDQFNTHKDISYQRRQMSARHDGLPPGAQDKPGALVEREKMTARMMNGGS